jgi:hypothetical protein
MPLPADSYLNAASDNAWIREFIAEWKLDQATGGGDVDLELRVRSWISNSPDAALSLLMSLVRQCAIGDTKAEEAIGNYFFWFLQDHGNEYVDIIGNLVLHEVKLRRVLGHVYVDGLGKGIRHKIEAWRD